MKEPFSPARVRWQLPLTRYLGALSGMGSACLWLWVTILAMAGLAKLWDPAPAGQLFSRLGIGRGYAAAILLGALELWIASSCVLSRMRHRVAIASAGLLGVLIVGGRILLVDLLDGGSCGCFGAFDVPAWLLVGTAACGVIGVCLYPWSRRSTLGTRQGLRSWVTLVWILGLLGASWAFRVPRGSAVAEAELAQEVADARSVLMVGSLDCDHCLAALRRIRRAAGRGASIDRLWLLVKEDETERSAAKGLRVLRVPDALWWRLVGDAPPQFYRAESG